MIAWGKANDKPWAHLDDVVSSKLKTCNSLTEWLDLLQNRIYNEAANIFGQSQPTKRNLAGQSRRTKLSIQLVKECEDITNSKLYDKLPIQDFNYSKKRFDSLKKECPANFLPFYRDF